MHMITAAQLRAARALLGIDQRALAQAAHLSVPTIQRMEASAGVIRGTVDSLMKLVGALEAAGIELISDNAVSAGGGRGVRLKAAPRNTRRRSRAAARHRSSVSGRAAPTPAVTGSRDLRKW
jgi:transcriptional regulator with XRE-family HTH domain